ncbi:MmgE/PrpD family protein [Nonomuraea cavernae]|uniref:MmgE/Prp family protein n=1 Tax=Nonomuraea cavernae TaxID=2045107 RepID=A0A917YU45_9ACTN|nr:MmgE/PrpD family protein [Nonomuraea cavernae]MCA2185488.1 MmgE/PrpD family protein [Nonomuraea cavernae]GGO66627.1 MmgE/Prp family protein [Nonomuraea cavernae]
MIARELAVWGLGVTEIPEPVRRAAVRHLLDGFGTALGAYRTGAATPAIEVARGLGGPPEAAILGTGELLSAPAAALANGTLVHALDFDDTHAGGLVHATAVVLPAAFAVGQQVGATGREVLTAAVVGYETVCRVAAAAPHGFHARGLHATMVAGVFSSALVTARLLGLDAERAVAALGIAGSQAGGLLAFLGTGASTKQLHPGFASQAGIIAARLAAAGATGPETVFDGPHGVFDTLSAAPADLPSIVAGLGESWETTRIGIKPYAACQLSHATVGATLEAMAREPFGPGDVAGIRAQVHPDSASVVCDTSRDLTRPASPYAAKFSLPWTVAALVTDGGLSLGTFETGSIARPEVSELAARVRWDVTDFPGVVAADAPGRVTVTLKDGREVTGAVRRSEGGGDNPLSRASLIAKFEGNAGGPATELVETIESLDQQPDAAAVMRAAAGFIHSRQEFR